MASPINREQETGRLDATAIDAKWQARWAADELYRTPDESDKPNWYSLTMYPYPSGILHVGHWYAFVAPDAFARFKRRQGFNVLFPMGFDAFGLPAENAAIKSNIHPSKSTYQNIEHMRKQYVHMGASIDWERQVITCDPDYYHWNQWIFLRMLERGLAYRAKGSVWWCPNDQTVLANEQVLDGSICERCGAEVYKRDLEQWYFGITKYADELIDGLNTVDWPERVKTMQRNWIGRSEGHSWSSAPNRESRWRCSRPGPTRSGARHLWSSRQSILWCEDHDADQRAEVDRVCGYGTAETEIERLSTDEARPKTGVFTGAYAINPVNDERIPIWIADYVLMGYGTGAIMAVPYGDQRDFDFARAFGLPIRASRSRMTAPGRPRGAIRGISRPWAIINSGPSLVTHTPRSRSGGDHLAGAEDGEKRKFPIGCATG